VCVGYGGGFASKKMVVVRARSRGEKTKERTQGVRWIENSRERERENKTNVNKTSKKKKMRKKNEEKKKRKIKI